MKKKKGRLPFDKKTIRPLSTEAQREVVGGSARYDCANQYEAADYNMNQKYCQTFNTSC